MFKRILRLTKVITLALIAILAVGCSAQSQDSNQDSDKLKIGIIQIVEHLALDDIRKGFIDGLADAGFKDSENIEINYYNAQGDASNLKSISQILVSGNPNLIVAIATAAAQSVASETTEIPILATGITDLVGAGLVQSDESPNTNVTGMSDFTPISSQFDLIAKVLPDAKTVGILYTSSEDNAKILSEYAIENAQRIGLEPIVQTVADINEIPQVTEALVRNSDVIYISTDNTLAEAMPVVVKIAEEQNVPVVVADEGSVYNGALMTEGIDYYLLGRQTSEMAVKILTGQSEPKDMPVEYLNNTQVVINLETAGRLGITIPEDVLQTADKIIQ